MSVPAFAALTASVVGETPRAAAVPVSESVTVTPRKPNVVRRREAPIACDHPAAFAVSYAGYVAFDSMIIGTPLAIAAWYGLSAGASADFEAVMVTTCESVLAEAKPMPGKCFMEGTPPPETRPVAKAFEREAVVDALKDHVRPCWYMNELVDDGTSATGARSVLMPAQRSTNAV